MALTLEGRTLLDRHEVADVLGVGTRTLHTWRQDGKFPPPVRIGYRPYWRQAEVSRWLDSLDYD